MLSDLARDRVPPGGATAMSPPPGEPSSPSSEGDSATGRTSLAPPFPTPTRPTVAGDRGGIAPAPSWRIGDFAILNILGEGGFATVYLARQISLDRLVALKVSVLGGHEARTLATLEHAHIVRVFSEEVDGSLRLVCMQYVPGTNLARVIESLRDRDPAKWCGLVLLEVVDASTLRPGAFDPAALRWRESLARADWTESVCAIGLQLAEALAYAHEQGVLHRDLKPDNILIDQYGRLMLADFNMALDSKRNVDSGPEPFGGTLPYMAPEHLDALGRDAPRESVDERSDLYALGVVLFELLTGVRPSGGAKPALDRPASLRAMAAERRAGVPSVRALRPDVPEVIERVLRRCLEPDPARRFPTAEELARALEGCGELRRVERELPPAGPLTRMALRHPFRALVILALLPHVLGSVVNISYNSLQIFPDPGCPQRAVFFRLVWGYNAVAYPVCLMGAYRLIVPVLRIWWALFDGRPVGGERVAAARRQVVALPLWAAALSCLGWLPGGLAFPVGLWGLGQPVGLVTCGHLFVSLWISGLIALTYSFFGIQFLALRVLYPRLWVDVRALRATAHAELGGQAARLHVFQLLGALIPLASAALMVGLGPEVMARKFRLLVTVLITAGMAGIASTIVVSRVLTETIAVLTTPRPSSAPKWD